MVDKEITDLEGNLITAQVFEGEEFNKDFQFSLDETVDVMKRTVKQYLDELNFISPELLDLNYTDPVPPTPTQAELDFQAWVKDRADLKKLKELVAEGIVPANSTLQTTLQTKVTNGWKNAYFNQI
jgi:hypothetical protein